MLSFLPAPIKAVINLLLISINTLINAIPILLLSIVRPLLPFKGVQYAIERCNNFIYHLWMDINGAIMHLTCNIKFTVKGMEQVKVQHSCFIVSNHLSWADIYMICHLFGHRIPITKFFLKHSLVYIPVIGLVCLGLGMPFLRRYSKKELLKNPKLKGRDVQSTIKACRRLVIAPSTLVNFAEGTRCTAVKQKAVNSPYRHLMPPKAASLAVALGQVGREIDCLINLTLSYPGSPEKPFIALLQGKLKEVYAHVEVIPKEELPCGDYLNDKQFKHTFTLWLRDLWSKKDALLAREVFHDETEVKALELTAAEPSAPAIAAPEKVKNVSQPANLQTKAGQNAKTSPQED